MTSKTGRAGPEYRDPAPEKNIVESLGEASDREVDQQQLASAATGDHIHLAGRGCQREFKPDVRLAC